MAAPSGIVWGSTVGGYGRIGIYAKVTNNSDNTSVTVKVETWFWSKYSINDTSNSYYYNNLASSGSATSKIGSLSVKTTEDSGTGWSTTNQVRLGSSTYTYNRGTSAVKRYLYAKLADIDRVGGTMYASTTFTIPTLPKYTITYNANGGSGAPSSQSKWYGKNLTLSSTKPTHTGHSFQGWALTKADADSGTWYYSAGSTCGKNENLTLYAVWKANTYTVKFNANGGEGAPANQTKTYDVTLKLSSTKPTRTKHNFLGWSTSATATKATYAAGGNYTNNSGTTLYAVWEFDYEKPRITSVTVARCDSGGTSSDTGTYARVKFNWACDFNATGITIDWSSSSNSGSETISASGTSGTVNVIIGNGELNIERTYTIKITVADSNGNSYTTKTLNSAKFIIDIYNKGTGIAFGKAAELSGWTDTQWPLFIRSGARLAYGGSINGMTDTGEVLQTLEPYTSGGNLVIGRTLHNTKKGETYLQGYDVKISVSNAATNIDFRPYLRKGITLTLSIRTAGYVTNSGKDISFMIPLTAPIIGSPTVSAASINGFTLRQGEKYTHGSSSTAYVTPSKYTVGFTSTISNTTAIQYSGLYVTAEFSNTTNVTNNDSIGIYWNGTITFS